MVRDSVGKIDAKLAQLTPGSLRRQVMEALRHFRASWIELGRLLNDVVYGGDYKEWGYDDFEIYCARELGLRRPTVQKLMISYNYMRKYESKRLDGFIEPDNPGKESGALAADIPDFQTVELLDRARRREAAPEERLEELHRRAFSGDAGEPELRREIRQFLRPASRQEASGRDEARKAELAGLLRTSRELRRRLSQAGDIVPPGLRERVERCLVELEMVE
jgi:hypothetical protein